MKSLDPNIVIRFLVNDDLKQGEAVKRLFLKAEKDNDIFFITTPVILEVLYVLDSVYNYSRKDILNALESMLSMSILIFENTDAIQKFISSAGKTKIELEDLLIGVISKEAGCETTITIDKKAARSNLFELLV
jgi:predicted nucleic-acid-binding protein